MSSQTAQTARLGLRVIEPELALPRVQPGMLRRSRLLEMIDGGGGVALTVVDTPGGYGKTTLLRSWCIERREAVIWMTLDPDPAALQPWPGAPGTAPGRRRPGRSHVARLVLRTEGTKSPSPEAAARGGACS